jgi:hypothetical protein
MKVKFQNNKDQKIGKLKTLGSKLDFYVTICKWGLFYLFLLNFILSYFNLFFKYQKSFILQN